MIGAGLFLLPAVMQAQQDSTSVSAGHAVSSVDGGRLEKTFSQNLLNTLFGEIPGLTLTGGSGEPGADSPSYTVRGFNTFSNTDRSALVLVDGFEASIDNLSVYEIESISILKDASAAALYGMRAANGVILVTTKRGAEHPLEVNVNAQAGVNFASHRPAYLDAYNYALLYNEARANDGLAPFYDKTALEAYLSGSNPYLYPNVNWYDIMVGNTSLQQNYDISMRGGNQTLMYFVLLNLSDNNGFFKGTDLYSKTNSNSKFTRYNVRSNVDVNITRQLSAHLDLAANIDEGFGPAGGAYGIYNAIANVPANAFPVYNPDGSYGGNATFSNPLGDLLEKGLNSYGTRNIQSNIAVKYAFDGALKGLVLSGTGSFSNYFRGESNKRQNYLYYALAYDGAKYYYQSYGEKTSVTIDDSPSQQWRNMSANITLDFRRRFGNHQVAAFSEFFSDILFKRANSSLKDSEFPYKYIGERGRVSYGYDKRYEADFTYAYEGTNLYYKGKRFGFFPAVSLGWVASEEGFLKGVKAVNYLKLRASYGLVGNDAIVGTKRFAYTQDYKYTASYYLGPNNTQYYGMMEDNVADLNRTWEKERRLNIGAEGTLMDKLDFSFDWFLHKRSDILVNPTGEIPGFLGMTFAYLNLGRTSNTGFEASVGYRNKTATGVEYYGKANFWMAKNRIDYQAEELRLWPNLVTTGLPIGQPFGLEAIGLFKDNADIASSPEQTFSNVKPGDIKYRDVNGDNVVDNQDITAIGKTGTPEKSGSFILGLRWKGFDMEAMLYGVAGRSVYLSGNNYWAYMNQYAAPASALLRWTPETSGSALYPRLSSQANQNNTQYSSYWLKDGSFLKLKYVEAGYTFPLKLRNGDNASSIRLFINGTNLFSIHALRKYTNADPESMNGFPPMRTVSGGLKFKF